MACSFSVSWYGGTAASFLHIYELYRLRKRAILFLPYYRWDSPYWLAINAQKNMENVMPALIIQLLREYVPAEELGNLPSMAMVCLNMNLSPHSHVKQGCGHRDMPTHRRGVSCSSRKISMVRSMRWSAATSRPASFYGHAAAGR